MTKTPPKISAKRKAKPASAVSTARPDKPELVRVQVFDTTLRDGEQSPGASMSATEKLEVALLLDEMGVDIIEAGFPIASHGDFDSVRAVAREVKRAEVCGLARAQQGDIDRAGEAIRAARRPRLHTFLSTSPVHRKHKLNMSKAAVLEAIATSVQRARQHTDMVQWSPEDATRTEPDFLCRAVETAVKAGARVINIPDTVGYTMPEEFAALFEMLRARVPNIDKVVLSAHCHNDLGLAVANSLAAIKAGARQVECTINGIGERAGNAALEEIVMGLRVRKDLLAATTGIKTKYLARASKLVAAVTAFPVQYNKAIVGKNAFAHESGVHQDGMLKNAQTYEIMTPESVGIASTSLVMGKHSGRHAFRKKLAALGYDLGANQLEDAFQRFKSLADKKKHVFDEDLVALVDDSYARGEARLEVLNIKVQAGTKGPQRARVQLKIDGRTAEVESSGSGPVDAIFCAIRTLFPHKARLQLYQVHAVTSGSDAQAEVSVRLEDKGHIATGRAADTDTLVASARAYVSALNYLLVRQQKKVMPQSLTA